MVKGFLKEEHSKKIENRTSHAQPFVYSGELAKKWINRNISKLNNEKFFKFEYIM